MPTPLPELSPRARHRLLWLVKLGVTVTLLYLLFRYIGWRDVAERLRRVDLALVVLALLLRYAGIALSALKWKQILAVQGIAFRFGQLHRWYHSGLFLSQFLPTNIGGDGYRIYKTWNNPRGRSSAVLAVAVERVTGMLALFLLGYAAATLIYLRGGDPLVGWMVAIGTFAVVAALLTGCVLWRKGLLRRVAASPRSPAALVSLLRFGGEFPRHPGKSGLIVLISFAFHLTRVLVVWLLILGFGVNWSVLEVAIVSAAKEAVALLPISLGGIGPVDGAFVYLMSHFGLDPEIALSTMIVLRAQLVLVLLPGAYFYFLGRERAEPGAGATGPGAVPIGGSAPPDRHIGA